MKPSSPSPSTVMDGDLGEGFCERLPFHADAKTIDVYQWPLAAFATRQFPRQGNRAARLLSVLARLADMLRLANIRGTSPGLR